MTDRTPDATADPTASPNLEPLLAIGAITPRMRARLAESFAIIDLPPAADPAEDAAKNPADRAALLADHGPRIRAVATMAGLPPEVAAALPALEIVASFGVGYDSIDAGALAARGVTVTNTPDVLNDEVAVTAILLWFAVARRLVPLDAWARSGDWETRGAAPLTRAAHGRRVGLLGMGRIGQTIADKARAFGAEIHYHSRTPRDVAHTWHDSPAALAAAVDVLIAITPGGAATRNLVDAGVLAALGPDGIVVNVARGSVVDEPALIAALQAGTIAGAGLDVFAAEPHIPDALKAMDNVVLLPHVGSATVETRDAMSDLVTDNLLAWAAGNPPLTPVPECQPD